MNRIFSILSLVFVAFSLHAESENAFVLFEKHSDHSARFTLSVYDGDTLEYADKFELHADYPLSASIPTEKGLRVVVSLIGHGAPEELNWDVKDPVFEFTAEPGKKYVFDAQSLTYSDDLILGLSVFRYRNFGGIEPIKMVVTDISALSEKAMLEREVVGMLKYKDSCPISTGSQDKVTCLRLERPDETEGRQMSFEYSCFCVAPAYTDVVDRYDDFGQQEDL